MTSHIILKDRSRTEMIQLDRLRQFDQRSLKYSIMDTIEKPNLRSYTWRCEQWFDQGKEGACVAYALAHELAARPAEVEGIHDKWLKEKVYWEAQKIDPWDGGSYPGAGSMEEPFYEGTSVLAGVKVLHSYGFFKEYRWAFSIDDLLYGLGHSGPAVIGCDWYEGMVNPDSNGFIKPTGRPLGGHAVLVRGLNVKDETVTIRNSWGKSWGVDGDCYMKFEDLEMLLRNYGEAVFLDTRTASPMVPYDFST